MRKMGIGPRLSLFVLVPITALLAVIGFLVLDDVQNLRNVQDYGAASAEVIELVEIRSAIQEERHLLVDPSADNTDFESLDASFAGPVEEALRMRSSIDVVQLLPEARRLRNTGELENAAAEYTRIINEFDRLIAAILSGAPLGEADVRAASMLELLSSQESFLQTDLEFFAGEANPLTMVRQHEAALRSLRRFTNNASQDASVSLRELTASDDWQLLEQAANDGFNIGAGEEAIGIAEFRDALDVRRVALAEIARVEAISSQAALAELESEALDQLVTLAATIGVVLVVAALGTLLLRRSIVQPLSVLTMQARRLSSGEVTAVEDPARDEIAEVSNAFTNLTDTVDHLFGDIDRVSKAIHIGDHGERIDTKPLEGDWERLANTMNATLATSAAHHEVTSEELDRRMVISEISNAAVLSDDVTELTARVLRELPRALVGSHAHLHQHPSGPPLVDMNVTLEPPFSALELPTSPDRAKPIRIGSARGVASLVEFADGPPAVLTLMYGPTKPAQDEPLVSLVETSSQILAQAYRREAAESNATHSREHDHTTGLANVAQLHRWFESTPTPKNGWTVVGVTPQLDDLDGAAGREAHDQVLGTIGHILHQMVQGLSAAQGVDVDLVRVGDPEFVAVVPTDFGEQVAMAFASRFADPINVGSTSLPIEATIGIAEVNSHSIDLTEALSNVASAVRRGQHRITEIVPFETRYREDARRRTQLLRWLEQAIENRDLTIHFQPIVNATTTVTEGYECLIRGSLDGTPVSPAEFIPLAEESGLIFAIGEFVLREACAALPFLPGDTPYVAVNISPLELSDPELLGRIERVLIDSNVERERIVFEVTEGVETSAEDAKRLEHLRALGVKIAIDDFGSGHANLSYLSSLPAQILKLDRSLITPIVEDPNAASIVLKAIEMAHQLGMTVVGEGVEDNDELDALRRMRCDRIQGWFTGRPAPLESFIEVAEPPASTTMAAPETR